jgi:hypothetical protein
MIDGYQSPKRVRIVVNERLWLVLFGPSTSLSGVSIPVIGPGISSLKKMLSGNAGWNSIVFNAHSLSSQKSVSIR